MKNISFVLPKYQTGYVDLLIVAGLKTVIDAFGDKVPRLGNQTNILPIPSVTDSTQTKKNFLLVAAMSMISHGGCSYVTFNLQKGEVWLDSDGYPPLTITRGYESILYRITSLDDVLQVEKSIKNHTAKWDFMFKGVHITRDENGVVEMNPTGLLKEAKAEVERRTAAGE